MPAPIDPSRFPLREGGTVPRDLVLPHAATLDRRYLGTLDTLVQRGGISVFELLMLQPPPPGATPAAHARDICGLTVVQAMARISGIVAAWQAKFDADAEAAMLAMFDEGTVAEENAQPTV